MDILDCLVTGRGISEAERTANTDYINTALAAGGEVHFPVDSLVEVNGNCKLPADVRVYLHGARLIARGNIAGQRLFEVQTGGWTIGIRDGVLEGFTEAEVTAAGNTGSYGIFGRADMTLALQNVSFDEWFGNAMQGSSGVSVQIDGGRWQAWNSHIAGGDGAKEYVVRDATFGRVGSGKETDHQLYVNPDVWLYLECCDFQLPQAGWSVHYYGSDQVGPERTPTFRDCVFRGKVFGNENCHTLVEGCDFISTMLQIQNDTLISNCRFFGDGTPAGRSMLYYRTGGAKYVRLANVRGVGSNFNCEANNPTGTLYRFDNLHLTNCIVVNNARDLNHFVIDGGYWEDGQLVVKKGTAHLDGHLRMDGVSETIASPGVVTKGDVVYL